MSPGWHVNFYIIVGCTTINLNKNETKFFVAVDILKLSLTNNFRMNVIERNIQRKNQNKNVFDEN